VFDSIPVTVEFETSDGPQGEAGDAPIENYKKEKRVSIQLPSFDRMQSPAAHAGNYGL